MNFYIYILKIWVYCICGTVLSVWKQMVSLFLQILPFLVLFPSSRSHISCALDIFIMLFGSLQYFLFFFSPMCFTLYQHLLWPTNTLLWRVQWFGDLLIPSAAFFSSIKLIFIYFPHFFFIIISSLKSSFRGFYFLLNDW